jgi:long-chain acyl-CoA synthetase
MSLANYLRQSREQFPNKVALIYGDRSWTYQEFDQITDQIAAALVEQGIQIGDRIALHLPNCPELVLSYFACFKLGAIAVPLVPLFKGAELEYILNHCEAKVCISHPAVFGEVQSVRPTLTYLQQVFLVGGMGDFPAVQPFAQLLKPLELPTDSIQQVSEDAIAAILYTSGTTARPKGVTHTHQTLQNTVAYNIEWINLNNQDILVGGLALVHIFGFSLQLLTSVMVGATLVILPNREPETLLQALQHHRATRLYGLPVLYHQLVNHPEVTKYDLSSLTACFVGGDGVAISLHERFKQLVGIELTEGCGMTEVIPYSMNPPYGEKRLGSIGKAMIGMTLRIVDEHGNDLAPGKVGEIWVKGTATMIGYWNNPEATAATLEEGWMKTGDLGYVDTDGYYWFVSRKKEIIVRGGSNISPLEVESVLYQHPAVREAGVIGVPDSEWGEVVHAYVAVRDGIRVDEITLKTFVGERLSAHKVPAAIAFLPELPKGLTGKIHRKTLKTWAIEHQDQSPPSPPPNP